MKMKGKQGLMIGRNGAGWGGGGWTRPWVKFPALQKRKKLEGTINSVSKSRDQAVVEKVSPQRAWSSFSRKEGRE